ncbi:hypothetical protein CEP53_013361, partial [Fusarium sp. AF-6]
MASIFSLGGLFTRRATAPAAPTTRLFSTTTSLLARAPPKLPLIHICRRRRRLKCTSRCSLYLSTLQ